MTTLITGFLALTLASGTELSLVPKMELDFWNGYSRIQISNNCYNYSTNRVTYNYAQPGEASGQKYAELSCESVYLAASKDLGLQPTEFFPYSLKNDETLIALVVAPDYDYHWYRRDDTGLWSHKMGGTPATSTDDNGEAILSPEKASRGLYTEFCGYFKIKNFPTDEHEQNGGYVRIGNMSRLPDENTPSQIQILKFSGRENPSFSLQALLAHPHFQFQLAGLKERVMQGGSVKDMSPLHFQDPHLGYNGIEIQDFEGLLFKKNTFVRLKNGLAIIHSSDGSVEVLKDAVFSKIESSLLKLH